MAPSTRATTFLRGRPGWSPTPPGSRRCWSVASRYAATAPPPVPCPALCCGPDATPRRSRLVSETANPVTDEFDPAELQGGLLMQVENVHERLRDAQAKHRVMVGNPFSEVRAGPVGDLGVTVLGYDECQTVLTHPDTFSSSL